MTSHTDRPRNAHDLGRSPDRHRSSAVARCATAAVLLLPLLVVPILLSAAPSETAERPPHRVVAGRLADEAVRELKGEGVTVIDLDAPEFAELDAIRRTLRAADTAGTTATLHGRDADRVATAWGAYLALDRGVAGERAVAEAKSAGLGDPLTEATLRALLRSELHSAGDAWMRVDPHEMDPTRRTQMRQSLQARDMTFSRFLATLGAALARPEPQGGPVAATAACRVEAPRIAATVSMERAVMIGRTSARLRNPRNRAPAWAIALLGDDLEIAIERATDAASFPMPRFAQHPDGSFGAVMPIRTLETCLMCHGPLDRIEPALRDILGVEYPTDLATGYREGDLRGWFWVEVPPTRTPD